MAAAQAELLHHSKHVGFYPVFDWPAVFDTPDVDARPGDAPAGRRHAQKHALVRALSVQAR
ncbi:MAG: hypothetical protein R2838_20390 [Caldilineaceae bacterium]